MIEDIRVVLDEDISTEEQNFYSISVNGDMVLECVPEREVGQAITALIKHKHDFPSMYV